VKLGADFDALIARFSADPGAPISLAVSGGSDSLALLWLADEWAARAGRHLQVFTVDHGFREEAQAEADYVARLSQKLGHPHQTLTWQTPKKTQSAARRARYQLLCDAAREVNGQVILTGHTFDDVIETALIRRRRQVRDASIAGPTLAASAPVWPEGRGITMLRPLVHTRRAPLRDLLTKENWSWIDDPSNEAVQFERARVRLFLARHPRLNDICHQFVRALQQTRARQDAALGDALNQVAVSDDGMIETTQTVMADRLLSILARCASGTDSEPRAHAISDMQASLTKVGQRQTLGGAWFQKTKAGLRIGRDPGETQHMTRGEIYDGRFERAVGTDLPSPEDQAFLVRHAAPDGSDWREIISERISHIAACLQTPLLKPVES